MFDKESFHLVVGALNAAVHVVVLVWWICAQPTEFTSSWKILIGSMWTSVASYS